MGDVNFDGSMDVQDAVLVTNHILGTSDSPFTQQQIDAGDMNADNSVDIQDLVLMVTIILAGDQ